jgi:hypothetical protein
MTTGRMTLRVSYDGGRTYGPVRTVQVNPRNAVILGSPTKYPPCGCPRCTGRLSSPRSASAALAAVPSLSAGIPVGVPEKREVSPMVEENTMSAAPEGGGLLIAKRKIVAARTRAEQESDVSSGRSDGND